MAKGRARRGHGEGSIYQRADGYWIASVEAGRYPNGKRRRARIVRRTKRQVLAALDDLKRRAASGAVGPDRTVAEMVSWWIENVAATGDRALAESTLTAYRARLRCWIDGYDIAHIKTRKLAATDVQQWMNDLAGRRISPASRNAARVLLGSALKYAVGVGMIERNVVAFVGGAKATSKLDDALSAEELNAVSEAARGDRLEALWTLALKYGMRPAEILALTWGDIDLDRATLNVAKAKSLSGVRELPLLAGTLDALKAHRRAQRTEQLAAGPLWQDSGHVFTTPDGRPLPRRTFNSAWHDLLARAGVTDRRPYCTRHTAATTLLEAGVPLEVVSAILGHSGIAITSDVYAKVRGDLKRQALTKLDDTMRGTP